MPPSTHPSQFDLKACTHTSWSCGLSNNGSLDEGRNVVKGQAQQFLKLTFGKTTTFSNLGAHIGHPLRDNNHQKLSDVIPSSRKFLVTTLELTPPTSSLVWPFLGITS
jgi:hypothetical protein